MTFDDLKVKSWHDLQLKTVTHQGVWRLGAEAYWDLDQDTGMLVFTFDDGVVATCPAQIIGTFDSTDGSWMWAWNNPSIQNKLTRDSEFVHNYGIEHGISELTVPEFDCDENEAWAMTALAVYLCSAQGAYRGPAGSTYVFITFGVVQLSQS